MQFIDADGLRGTWRRYAVVACSIFLSACALSPTSKQAAEFGKAATASLEAYTSAREAEMTLRLKRAVDDNACRYVGGAGIGLPVRATPPVPSELAQQIAFLQAVIAYSNALANATNPDGVTELEKQADGLVSAASATATAVATRRALTPPSDLPVVGPALSLASHIGINLIELEMRDRIRQVVDETDYVLVVGVGKLVLELGKDRARLKRAYNSWLDRRVCVLKAMRARAPNAGANLYQEYINADAEARGYLAKIAVLDKAAGMLTALLEAHSALLSDKADFNAALGKIQLFAKDIAAVQAALKKARET